MTNRFVSKVKLACRRSLTKLTKPEKQWVTHAYIVDCVDGISHELDLGAIRDWMRRSHEDQDCEKKLHCWASLELLLVAEVLNTLLICFWCLCWDTFIYFVKHLLMISLLRWTKKMKFGLGSGWIWNRGRGGGASSAHHLALTLYEYFINSWVN